MELQAGDQVSINCIIILYYIKILIYLLILRKKQNKDNN